MDVQTCQNFLKDYEKAKKEKQKKIINPFVKNSKGMTIGSSYCEKIVQECRDLIETEETDEEEHIMEEDDYDSTEIITDDEEEEEFSDDEETPVIMEEQEEEEEKEEEEPFITDDLEEVREEEPPNTQILFYRGTTNKYNQIMNKLLSRNDLITQLVQKMMSDGILYNPTVSMKEVLQTKKHLPALNMFYNLFNEKNGNRFFIPTPQKIILKDNSCASLIKINKSIGQYPDYVEFSPGEKKMNTNLFTVNNCDSGKFNMYDQTIKMYWDHLNSNDAKCHVFMSQEIIDETFSTKQKKLLFPITSIFDLRNGKNPAIFELQEVHSNLIYIDLENLTIEKYEPNGSYMMLSSKPENKGFVFLKSKLIELLKAAGKMKPNETLTPLKPCENNLNTFSAALCSIVSAFVFMTRVLNPEITFKDIAKNYDNAIKQDEERVVYFIKYFIQYIQKYYKKYYNN